MALIKCQDCGTDVSDAAPACPKCARPIAMEVRQSDRLQRLPAPARNSNSLSAGFVVFALVCLGLWIYFQAKGSGESDSQQAATVATSSPLPSERKTRTSVIPAVDAATQLYHEHAAQQSAFEQTRLGQLGPYNAAANEIQKSAIFNRANAQMRAYWANHGANFSDWTGRLSSSVTSHGGSEVDIEITSDAGTVYRESNISNGSALYSDLSTLPDGAMVAFSGTFSDADSATGGERSLTEIGSLDEPTYNVDLSSVAKIDQQEAFAPPEPERQTAESTEAAAGVVT
ncbi:MAG: hypothetical protein ABI197_10960, partial [Granulicella sp.]